MNTKGGMFDIFLAMILSFILVICCVIFVFASHTVNDKLLELAPSIQASFGNETNVTQIINTSMGRVDMAYQSLKWITIMLIFGYFLTTLISAVLVKTHPVAFVGYIFIAIVSILVSIYISNTYETLMNTAQIQSVWFTFTGANYIFLYLPIWITVISFVAGILMYSNIDNGEQY